MSNPSLQTLQEVVRYLDETNQFEVLRKQATSYKHIVTHTQDIEDKFIMFKCTLKINLSLLLENSEYIANLLLTEPYLAKQIFTCIALYAVSISCDLPMLSIDAMRISLEISLPMLPDILISNVRQYPRTGLFVFRGVLVAHTVQKKYLQSAVYRCSISSCTGSTGVRVSENDPACIKCQYCGNNTEEVHRARVMGNQVLGKLVDPLAFESSLKLHQGATICFRDEFSRNLELGVAYNVVVSSAKDYLLAWGVEPCVTVGQRCIEKNIPPSVPESISKLKEHIQKTCSYSPWALTSALASQLASDLFPSNAFFHLKVGLLLSLVSQGISKTQIPILGIGLDCCNLLQHVSTLATRKVALTISAVSGSTGGIAGTEWFEAGPLILARSGVCYLGDWAKFGHNRNSISSQVLTAIESGQIHLTSCGNTALGATAVYQLKTSVWTYWSGSKSAAMARNQLRHLIEVFGMPFIGDGGADSEAMSDHILAQAMGIKMTPSRDVIPDLDLKQYLEIASSISVEFTPAASKLLCNYFVASRRERPEGLPVSAVKMMTALSESHARLCLRNKVICEDVVLVAYLYEQSITAFFGKSLMSPPPAQEPLRVGADKPSIPQQVFCDLQTFSVWLDQYIKSLLSVASANCSISEE